MGKIEKKQKNRPMTADEMRDAVTRLHRVASHQSRGMIFIIEAKTEKDGVRITGPVLVNGVDFDTAMDMLLTAYQKTPQEAALRMALKGIPKQQ